VCCRAWYAFPVRECNTQASFVTLPWLLGGPIAAVALLRQFLVIRRKGRQLGKPAAGGCARMPGRPTEAVELFKPAFDTHLHPEFLPKSLPLKRWWSYEGDILGRNRSPLAHLSNRQLRKTWHNGCWVGLLANAGQALGLNSQAKQLFLVLFLAQGGNWQGAPCCIFSEGVIGCANAVCQREVNAGGGLCRTRHATRMMFALSTAGCGAPSSVVHRKMKRRLYDPD